MSVLFVVRHGQASFFSDNYDQLSPLGQHQSKRLGDYWAQQELVFDQVYVGPLQRHRQTHDAVAQAYHQRGVKWPTCTELPELCEYDAEALMKHSLPLVTQQEPQLRHWWEQFKRGEEPLRYFQKLFETIIMRWIRGELEAPEVEPWATFRQRIQHAKQRLTQLQATGQQIAAFCSGGPVAAFTGLALELEDTQIAELSWQVYNTAYAEFMYTKDKFTLRRFNASPHIETSEDLTLR